MNKLLFISALFMLVSCNLKAQSFEEYDENIRKYLIDQKELDNMEDATSIFSYEIIKNNEIVDNNCGIYRIGTFSDHGLTYLFCLDKKQNIFVFLDFKDIIHTITEVLTFVDKMSCKITDKEKLDYIYEILQIARINENAIPWKL